MNARMEQPPHNKQQEAGAALLLTLTLVLILTILGIASVQTTSLREKMARNNRDMNIAFQAAMAAILEAEALLEKMPSLATLPAEGGAVTCAGGLCRASAQGDWHNPATYTSATADMGTAQAAKYLIEYIPDPEGRVAIEPMDSTVEDSTGGIPTHLYIFRITARGTGNTSAAVTIIQTSYGKELTPEASTQTDEPMSARPSNSTGRLSWRLLDSTSYQ